MIRPSQALRLIYISWVLLKHGLDELILATHLFRPVRFLLYFTPWYWLRGELPERAVRIRCALEDLGPIFVKFGQILSTRRDLIPDDIAIELSKLQDRVPPFAPELARALIEKAYKKPLTEVFESFEAEPFASASIAQVHGAVTKDHESVVVKVVRPGIEKIIRRDVGLLYIIADLAQKYWRDGKRLRPRDVIVEYEQTILDELDLIREGANASQLRRNFQHTDSLYIPAVYWDLTRRNVLVLERIYGTPISHFDELKKQEIDFDQLSERGVEIFFTQVFRDNFFHADMHPGNIFVSPDGTYIAVDFGIMGTLSQSDKRYLAEILLAFFNRDYRQIAELHVESGWVPSNTRIDEFESAIRSVAEPIFERPLKEISFGHLLLRLFQTARRFNMEVQPQLVLLQKTLLNIEGLGRQLNPNLDLWKTAKPFLERWTDEQLGVRAFTQKARDDLPKWLAKSPEMPLLIYDLLSQAKDGKLKLQTHSTEVKALRRTLEKTTYKKQLTMLASSLIIGASVIVAMDGYSPKMLANVPIIAWMMGGFAVILIIGALLDQK